MSDEVRQRSVFPIRTGVATKHTGGLGTHASPLIKSKYRQPAGVPNYKYLNGNFRRTLDVSMALALLLLLAPLFGVIATSIWLSSPGPVLFRQKRHGRRMEEFELLKFRSMHWTGSNEGEIVQAVCGDPRTTAVGAIIRRTSMDELPQLINVLRGQMSLVGPRPHAIKHDSYYMERISQYRDRFQARPGLTGLAQVSGSRGRTATVRDMERRIQLDVLYLQHASLALDCRIFAATFKEILFSKYAY